MRAAANYINNGYFQEALNILNRMPSNQRSARWYYFAAAANQGAGNNVQAMEYARQAVQMEPSNMGVPAVSAESGVWRHLVSEYGFRVPETFLRSYGHVSDHVLYYVHVWRMLLPAVLTGRTEKCSGIPE